MNKGREHGTKLCSRVSVTIVRRSARVGDYETFCRLCKAWEDDRNARGSGVGWQFTNADARIRLKRLYPKITP